MLLRAYRLSDKLGVIIIKLLVAATDATLAGLLALRRLILLLLSPFTMLFSRLFRGVALGGVSAAQGAMARRTAQREIDKTIVEDPLRRQNRLLSGLVVATLLALVAIVLWATNPARQPVSIPVVNDLGSAPNLVAETPLATPIGVSAALPTPVPTATPLPEALQVRGTIAYAARENGQTDIFALSIGSRTPIRLTDDAAHDRDPAWSPDGRRLAFASHRDGNWELYIEDFPNEVVTRMTFDLAFQGRPTWSPDGLFIAYESYTGNNLDIWIVRVDGTQPALPVPGMSPAPDFSPAWSPDGRRIAFVSWREGNQDIYLFNLDDQSVTNLTNTPLRDEDYPAWSPNGELVAFSALDEGLEKVFVLPVDQPGAVAQVVAGGRSPAWSPDGGSLVYTTDSVASASAQLIAAPYADPGVITTILPVPLGAYGASWTSAPLPTSIVQARSGQRPLVDALYVEREEPLNADPAYRLRPLNGVEAPYAALSERVNDSFDGLREGVLQQVGWDFLGTLQDAFWDLNRLPEPGEERRNWLMTGRGFAFNRNAIVGFPAPVEIVREDIDVETYWRVYVRVADEAQNGQLGEPLRRMPWDFLAREQRDVQAYDEGGRLRSEMPSGYYIDLTILAQDYGWLRMPAGIDWRANINAVNYWMFYKPDSLNWLAAMREIYAEGALVNFAPTVTPTQVGLTAATLTALPPSVPTAPEATAEGGE
jgi:TolB protein